MRKRPAILLIVLGLVLGAGQYFVQRRAEVLESGTYGCLALAPECGYCPGDPRPNCGRTYVADEATFGVPFAAERVDKEVFVVNFLVFFVPAVLAGSLVWWGGRHKPIKPPKKGSA